MMAAAVALIATAVPLALARLPAPLAGLPVSPIIVAILIGLAFSSLAQRRPGWSPGLQFTARPLLRLAVALIGLRLSLGQLGSLGLQALPLVAGALVSGLTLAWLLGRLLGVGTKFTALLAVGSAVCGVSAIAATAPALKPRAEETAYALACIALLGLLATLLYPWLLNSWLPDGQHVGLVLGASIQDTAQVTAAALLYEQAFGHDNALAAATVTKLLRNLSMLVVIPGVVWWVLRGERATGARPAFPWFIVGFLLLAVVRSVGDLFAAESPAWLAFLDTASTVSAYLFAMAMAAVGMGVRIESLRALGPKPALVALVASAGMAGVALLLVTAIA